MHFKDRFKRCFKFRFAVLYPLSAYLVLFVIPDDRSINSGLGFIVLGLLIRIWANGYAVKTQELTTCGPYAFLRHPLYLGTMLLFIGFVVMLKIYLLGLISFILVSIVYFNTIKKEEQLLLNLFKQSYLDYKKNVPLIFPRFSAYKGQKSWGFSFKRLIKSQEYKLFIWVIILVIIFHLKEELIVEKEAMNIKIVVLIAIAFILGAIDGIGELLKTRTK